MRIFGITGGSGTGKSTVSDIFRKLGVTVIDADKSAREVVGKGSKCLDELCAFFGNSILLSDGTLDRKKLGSIVFSDGEKLKTLNEITHKYIRADIEEKLSSCKTPLAAIDGAVIIGSNIEDLCEFIVSVIAKERTRTERIMLRDSISEQDAQRRIGAQPDDEFYEKHAEYVIHNDGDFEALKNETEMVLNEIKTRYKQ